MRRLTTIAIAATMTILFGVMFWAQVGVIATAAARAKTTQTYSITFNPIQTFEPVY